jgi:hypothetical protein
MDIYDQGFFNDNHLRTIYKYKNTITALGKIKYLCLHPIFRNP